MKELTIEYRILNTIRELSLKGANEQSINQKDYYLREINRITKDRMNKI